MKRLTSILFLLMISVCLYAQDSYLEEIEAYRKEQNADFRNPETSPLSPRQIKEFKGHDFYPADPSYRVEARFEATPKSRPFPLGTNKGVTRLYRRIGILHFELQGKAQKLEAYVQQRRFMPRGQTMYIFLPVIDETTGDETYGAGRYLHFEGIPEGETWVIDFNKLYNPLCAYNDRFECPKVPEANYLSVAIRAGVKDYTGH